MIDKEGKMIQASVWEINRRQIKYDCIRYNKSKGGYVKRVSSIWIEDIYDYRTEYKKVVEIRVNNFMAIKMVDN